jgi:hypothetical protein
VDQSLARGAGIICGQGRPSGHVGDSPGGRCRHRVVGRFSPAHDSKEGPLVMDAIFGHERELPVGPCASWSVPAKYNFPRLRDACNEMPLHSKADDRAGILNMRGRASFCKHHDEASVSKYIDGHGRDGGA